MPNEMDALRMDERQRLAWLLASRATLIAVGLAWVGLIGWDLAHGRRPWFLIAMVPVFAGVRAFFYRLYAARGAQLGEMHDQ